MEPYLIYDAQDQKELPGKKNRTAGELLEEICCVRKLHWGARRTSQAPGGHVISIRQIEDMVAKCFILDEVFYLRPWSLRLTDLKKTSLRGALTVDHLQGTTPLDEAD